MVRPSEDVVALLVRLPLGWRRGSPWPASSVDGDRTTEPAPIALLKEPILDFGRPNVFELIDADHREVLIEGVDALAAGRLAIVGEQQAGLINAIDVRRLLEELGKLCTGLTRERYKGRQDVRLIEQPLRPVRLYHALPVGKCRDAHASLP